MGSEQSSAGDTHNEFAGSADVVVQARTIYGGLHFHVDRLLVPISTRAAIGWFVVAGAFSAGGLALLRSAQAVGAVVCFAVAARIVQVTWRWWRLSREQDPRTMRRRLDDATAMLATSLQEQWGREERLRRLQDPAPLPVRWTDADPLLADHWANIGAREPIDLDGQVEDIVDVFERVPSHRLVVLGRAGAGKTILALRFALDYAKGRQAGDPVPVILGIATWDPSSQGLHSWVAERLSVEHPGLAATTGTGRSLAVELLRTNRVLPVLDGFDELPPQRRPIALRALNRTLGAGAPVLLTSRPDEYREAVEVADVFTAAAVVQLQPLRVTELADHLRRTTRKITSGGTITTKWEPVLARLEAPGAGQLRSALSTPLMIALARTAYSDTEADPAELLDTRVFPAGADVENHLLDRLIESVYDEPPEELGRRPRWRSQDAQRWLRFLARRLDSADRRDLAWWELGGQAQKAVAAVGMALLGVTSVALVRWLGFDQPTGVFGIAYPIWVTCALFSVVPLFEAVVSMNTDCRPTHLELRRGRRSIFFRAVGSLLLAAAFWFIGHVDWRFILAAGLVYVFRAVPRVPVEVTGVTSPDSLLRADRFTTIVFGTAAVVLGDAQRGWAAAVLLAPAGLLLVWSTAGGAHTVGQDHWVITLVATVLFLFSYGLLFSAWARFVTTRVVLAATGKLPWSVLAFLADAHQRGVLRQSGGVYQFRHARLQDRLAARQHDHDLAGKPAARLLRTSPVLRVTSTVVVFAGCLVLSAAIAVVPGPPGPYLIIPSACAMLDTKTVSQVISEPTKNGDIVGSDPTGHDTRCYWSPGSLVGPLRNLQLSTELYPPQAGENATQVAIDDFPRAVGAFGAGSYPIGGLCDEAAERVDRTDSGAIVAYVSARCGNLELDLSYLAEAMSSAKVTEIAEILTRTAVRGAIGHEPPAHTEPGIKQASTRSIATVLQVK